MRGYVITGIVVFVVVVLACLLLPAHSHVQGQAARFQCTNNLKSIVLAAHCYHDTNGSFPRGTHVHGELPPEERLSWMVTLLPFIEQDNVFKAIDMEEGWQSAKNKSAVNTRIKMYLCPAVFDPNRPNLANATHYVGLTGLGDDSALLPKESPRAGLFGYDRVVSLEDIKDGTSATIMVIETNATPGPWAAGGISTLRAVNADDQPYIGVGRPFGGMHVRERSWFRKEQHLVSVGLADGSGRWLDESINPQTFEALVTIAGGEKIDADDY